MNVRKGRRKPGLRAQHLAGLHLIDQILMSKCGNIPMEQGDKGSEHIDIVPTPTNKGVVSWTSSANTEKNKKNEKKKNKKKKKKKEERKQFLYGAGLNQTDFKLYGRMAAHKEMVLTNDQQTLVSSFGTNPSVPRSFFCDIGTAGAISLLVQSSLPVLLFYQSNAVFDYTRGDVSSSSGTVAKRQTFGMNETDISKKANKQVKNTVYGLNPSNRYLTARLCGGTNVPFSPSFDYVNLVLRPALAGFMPRKGTF